MSFRVNPISDLSFVTLSLYHLPKVDKLIISNKKEKIETEKNFTRIVNLYTAKINPQHTIKSWSYTRLLDNLWLYHYIFYCLSLKLKNNEWIKKNKTGRSKWKLPLRSCKASGKTVVDNNPWFSYIHKFK